MGCKLTISSESVRKQQGLGRADSAIEQLNASGLLTSCSATFLTAPVTASATAPVDLTYEKGLTKKVYKIQMAFANTKTIQNQQTHMAVLRMMLFKSFADFGLKDLAKSMTEFPCRACCENKMRQCPASTSQLQMEPPRWTLW